MLKMTLAKAEHTKEKENRMKKKWEKNPEMRNNNERNKNNKWWESRTIRLDKFSARLVPAIWNS